VKPSTTTYLPLRSGERPVENAPLVQTESGNQCIPQHYLEFHHTLGTIEDIVSQIAYSPRYPVFVSEDEGGIFVQIGVIGPDNYKSMPSEKIVFGRRWRVEPHLPTSEIIQTVFLALKKAREHEIREQFVLLSDERVTTPFNCHHDLPLMVHLSDELSGRQREDLSLVELQALLACMRFQDVEYDLLESLQLASGAFAVTLQAQTHCSDFIDIYGAKISFITPTLYSAALLHNIAAELIRLSDRHVDETFTFDGFARFSHAIDPFAIAEMSAKYRAHPSKFMDPNVVAPQLKNALKSMNYEVDQKRIPALSDSHYGARIRENLAAFGLAIT
jgi:hypothetical protein